MNGTLAWLLRWASSRTQPFRSVSFCWYWPMPKIFSPSLGSKRTVRAYSLPPGMPFQVRLITLRQRERSDRVPSYMR